MFHVDNPTGVPVMPPVAAELSKTTLYFTEGGNGIPPTYPGPDWFNIIQSELLEILRQANIKPDKNTTDQIMTALKKLFITNSGSAGAIAGLTGENNTFPYFTGEDTMALTPLSAFVRGILGKNTAGEIIEVLSLRDTVNKANSAVPNTRKVNGMALSSDITISNISGNAGTATRLQTARRINNVL
ncbi:TPA: phage tail protein, partial [Escherichia coli]